MQLYNIVYSCCRPNFLKFCLFLTIPNIMTMNQWYKPSTNGSFWFFNVANYIIIIYIYIYIWKFTGSHVFVLWFIISHRTKWPSIPIAMLNNKRVYPTIMVCDNPTTILNSVTPYNKQQTVVLNTAQFITSNNCKIPAA